MNIEVNPSTPKGHSNLHRRLSIVWIVCWLISCVQFVSSAQGKQTGLIESLKAKWDNGDAYAAFQLGFAYKQGQGVEKNLVEAANWFLLGAEKGDYQAALEFAGICRKGEGVEKDEDKAADWYVKIGKSNTWNAPIARASLLLSAMNYSLGENSIKPDKAKARAFFQRLFDVENALMKQGQNEMNESTRKANDALDTLLKLMKKHR